MLSLWKYRNTIDFHQLNKETVLYVNLNGWTQVHVNLNEDVSF